LNRNTIKDTDRPEKSLRLPHTLTMVIGALLLIHIAFTACVPVIQPPSPEPPVQEHPSTTPEPEVRDTVVPNIEITSSVDDSTGTTTITFRWTGNDNETPPEDLVYSFNLEGYDNGYSEFNSNTEVTYTEVPAGSYTFYVKLMDREGNEGIGHSTIEITSPDATQSEEEIQEPVISTLLVNPGSEVSQICVTGVGDIIFSLDAINAQLYKSEHGGYGWSNISGNIPGSPFWTALAAAPDNPDIIAVATDSGTEVYLSIDGGTNFTAMGLSGNLVAGEWITGMAISPSYGNSVRDLAVGTSTGSGGGSIWISAVSRFPGGWYNVGRATTGWKPGSSTVGVDVYDIEFSPSYSSDATILAIVASGPNKSAGDTFLYSGFRDLAGNTVTWNGNSGYPVELCETGQDTPGTPLTYADLALPWDYSGTSAHHRHIYACWSDNPPGKSTGGSNNDDVYRIDDTICYRLQVNPDAICSIAHYGFFSDGKLLAGAIVSKMQYDCPSTQVYLTLNPQSTCPTWAPSQKPPTGPHNAQVAWSPDGNKAYCGTSTASGSSYDQSAFSITINDNTTWNQIGLIDT
jgi:hypothetical protein